jgi:hypothetical protein
LLTKENPLIAGFYYSVLQPPPYLTQSSHEWPAKYPLYLNPLGYLIEQVTILTFANFALLLEMLFIISVIYSEASSAWVRECVIIKRVEFGISSVMDL